MGRLWGGSAQWILLCFHFAIAAPLGGDFPSVMSNDVGELTSPKANLETLVHVHAIWRHGDRTPAFVLPSDKGNGEASWLIGLGELTPTGIAQHYRLGKWLRRRYDSFLGKAFSPSEIYVRSSDFNRTLMSAQANMAGLFPPSGAQIWTKDLLWQPIPVHTVNKADDYMLYEGIKCPAAEAEQKRVFAENEQVRELERENAQLLKLIGEKSGLNITRFGLEDIWYVFDPLSAEMVHNDTHKSPEWVNASVWNAITRLYDISAKFYFDNDKLRRLRGGTLLKDITDRIAHKSRNLSKHREKFFAYSAHDMTMGYLLSVLGVVPSVFPLYASVILIESHLEGDAITLKVFYKNETDSERLFWFPIIGCDEPCSVEKFVARSTKYFPINWHRECAIAFFYGGYAGATVVLLVALFVVVATLIAVTIRRVRERRKLYSGRQLLPSSDSELHSDP